MKLYRKISAAYFIISRLLFNKDKQLYFLHQKKTAGTSLRALLEQQFALKDRHGPINIPGLLCINENVVKKLKLVIGHFDIEFIEYFKTNPNVITWLREPIERSYSEYKHWKTYPQDDDPHYPGNIESLTFEEYAQKSEYQKKRSNLQTRALSVGYFNPNRFFVSSNDCLIQAQRNLESFFCFGLVERMQESVDMLNYFMGWRPVYFDIRRNVAIHSSNLKSFSAKQLRLGQMLNNLDIQLYTYAQQLFADRYYFFLITLLGWDQAKKMLEQSYESIRPKIEAKLWQRYWTVSQKLGRFSTYTYTFDMRLFGSGWGDVEGERRFSEYPWRWTTSKSAELDLPLKRDIKLELRFHVRYSLNEKFIVKVDNQKVELKNIGAISKFGIHDKLYKTVIDANPNWTKKLTTLTFEVPSLVKPSEKLPNSTDTRELGIALDWIQIVPYK